MKNGLALGQSAVMQLCPRHMMHCIPQKYDDTGRICCSGVRGLATCQPLWLEVERRSIKHKAVSPRMRQSVHLHKVTCRVSWVLGIVVGAFFFSLPRVFAPLTQGILAFLISLLGLQNRKKMVIDHTVQHHWSAHGAVSRVLLRIPQVGTGESQNVNLSAALMIRPCSVRLIQASL